MTRRLALACVVAATFLPAGRALAGDNHWTALGPWTTGGANSLAVHPTDSRIFYASSGPSIFRSRDKGETWSWTDSGATAYEVGPIVLDPSSPATIFAAARGSIVRSEDGGTSWSVVYSNERAVVNGIALDSTNPPTIYAALEYPHGPSPGGLQASGDVLKSVDGGDSWHVMTSHQSFPPASVVVLDPRTHSTLYVGTFGGLSPGLYRSDNAGRSFKTINPPSFSCCVSALAADPGVSGRIYAGLGPGGPEGFLFRSDDRGEVWVEADAGIAGDRYVTAVAVLPGSGVLAATTSGLFKSVDAGASWAASGSGVDGTVRSLTVGPKGAVAYAVTDEGMFVTENAAQSWTRVASPFAPVSVQALAKLPGSSGELLAGGPTGAYLSGEGRTTWIQASTGLPSGGVQAVAVAPSRDCAGSCASSLLLAGTVQGLYRSGNGGASWSRFDNALFGSVLSIVTEPSDARIILIGTTLGSVARTSNAGSSWSNTTLGGPGHPVAALASDPDAPSTLFAADPFNIFKSTNEGGSWTTLLTNFGADSLAVTHGVVYAGTDRGVFASQDGGKTWHRASDGMTSLAEGLPGVPALAADPRLPFGIYAGTFFDGMFSSTDAGDNWLPLNDGLPNDLSSGYPPINALLADGEDLTTLEAGTSLGVYSLDVVLSSDREIGPLPQRRPTAPPRHTVDRF